MWRREMKKRVLLAAALVITFAEMAFCADTETGVDFKKVPIELIWYLAPIGSLVALIFAYVFYKTVMRAEEGTEAMQKISAAVREGAYAYLRRQYKVVALVFVALSLFFCILSFGLHLQSKLVPFAFLTGGFFSGLCGFLGIKTATSASHRTAWGARESLNRGLQIAFRSGAVMGLVVVGLGLLDICLWFLLLFQVLLKHYPHIASYLGVNNLNDVTVVMLCFGMGASTQALFARCGGGIFTKAADVGADLVGKVESGIPEDDPRNPATIADNVGDNVGDVAGMGADLYESYCGSILATSALGVAAVSQYCYVKHISLMDAVSIQLQFITAPMVLAGIGIILSILGVYFVRSGEKAEQKTLLTALRKGVYGSTILIVIGAAIIANFILPSEFAWGIFGSITAGLLAGVAIGFSTEYYTSDNYRPTKNISRQSLTGPATVIISGIATGMMSTGIPVIIVSVGTIIAYACAGGFGGQPYSMAIGLYGVGIAAVGMLSTLGITLATDAYGPIADNAGGNAQMANLEPIVRERTDALDALGNTTAATGKGFAIGSAALTAMALIAAYVEEIRVNLDRAGEKAGLIISEGVKYIRMPNGELVNISQATMSQFMEYFQVTLINPKVLVGVFIGAMMAFFFCALTMMAVGRAAGRMVEEVRRQFREKPGILEGKDRPDYARCVDISTRGAQREMIIPSLLAIIIPVTVGLVLGVSGVIGLLCGALSCGFVLAIMMANSGGAWDNAKKFIEKGNYGGKKSEPHKAAVVGDTVGDPFKDTSGPSLNILIKLMSMVSIVVAGLTVAFGPKIAAILGIADKAGPLAK
jgi:K(+)-stimulated pyrophosphate-energized sodium pump